MLTESQQAYLKSTARTQQIIVAALVAGVLMFLAVVLVLDLGEPQNQASAPFLIYFGIAGAVVALVAWAIVPGMIAGQMRDRIVAGTASHLALQPDLAGELGDVGPLGGVYQVRTIVAAALLEGAAFFNLAAYMLEQQWINLAAAGVLVVIIMASMPTYGRLESWVESELNSIEQLRQMRTNDAR